MSARWRHLRQRLGAGGVGAILVHGTSGTAGVLGAGMPLTFLAQLVLARQLGLTQYGYYAFALGCIMLLAVLSRLGMQTGLTRFTAAYRAHGKAPALRGLATRSTQTVAGGSALVGASLAAGALMLQARLSTDLVWTLVLAGMTLPPVALFGVVRGLLQGSRRPAKAMLPQRVLLPGITLLLVLAFAGTRGIERAPVAMGLTFCAALVALLIGAWWVRDAIGPVIAATSPDYWTREWLRVSLPLLLVSSMLIVMKYVDTIMLGALAGTDASGLYYPIARISEIAALGLASTNVVVAPMISELHSTGQRARLQRLLTLAAILTSALTLAIAGAFWVAGKWVLGVFGAAFTAGYPALLILLGGQLVNALCGPVGGLMTMTGHHDRAAVVLTSAALLNIALNATLIPFYGVEGAATATALSAAAWNGWMFAEVRRRHGLNPSVFTRWPRI